MNGEMEGAPSNHSSLFSSSTAGAKGRQCSLALISFVRRQFSLNRGFARMDRFPNARGPISDLLKPRYDSVIGEIFRRLIGAFNAPQLKYRIR